MWLNPELRPKRRRHPKRIFLNVYPELAILNVYPELRPKRRRHPKRIYCASFLCICSSLPRLFHDFSTFAHHSSQISLLLYICSYLLVDLRS